MLDLIFTDSHVRAVKPGHKLRVFQYTHIFMSRRSRDLKKIREQVTNHVSKISRFEIKHSMVMRGYRFLFILFYFFNIISTLFQYDKRDFKRTGVK